MGFLFNLTILMMIVDNTNNMFLKRFAILFILVPYILLIAGTLYSLGAMFISFISFIIDTWKGTNNE